MSSSAVSGFGIPFRNSADEWFYANGQTRLGPVSLQAVLNRIRSGEITGQTLVWRRGLPDWTFADESELRGHFYQQAGGQVSEPFVHRPQGLGPRVLDYAAPVSGAPVAGLLRAYWIALLCVIPASFFDCAALVWLVSFVLSMMLLYRFWSAIQDGNPRTTPGKAVGFCFIPFFNFYWVFQAVLGLALDMSQYAGRRNITGIGVSQKLAKAWCILVLAGFIPGAGTGALVAAFIIQIVLLHQFTKLTTAILRQKGIAA